MRAVRLLQPYRDGPAQIDLEELQIRWRDRRGLRFTARSAAGVTEIRVEVVRPLLRKRRWMEWARAAVDRLETLVLLVATRNLPPDRDRLTASSEEGMGKNSRDPTATDRSH